MPSELQQLARAVLARNQAEKWDTNWDSRLSQVSQSISRGTAKTQINQGDDLSVPLSHALGLGHWDSQQILGHHLGHRLGQSPDSAINANMPVGDMAQAKHDTGPYASALAALRAKCPTCVPEDRWHQALADATAFASEWGAQAQAFSWTVPELFGLHPVPERPAANYRRLSRYDQLGLVWCLRSRPVVELDNNGGNTPLSEWRSPDVPQAHRAGIGGDRQRGTGDGDRQMQPIGNVMQPTLQIAKEAAA